MGGHRGRPYSIFKMLLLLRKMDVIVDMVLTEAVVALAAGAVTKLQLGEIRVRPAADRALMIIQLLLLLAADPLGFPAEKSVPSLTGSGCGGTAGTECRLRCCS